MTEDRGQMAVPTDSSPPNPDDNPNLLSVHCHLSSSLGLAQMMTYYLENYFADHGKGALPPPGLYNRVLREIEKPLLQVVLQAVGGNQKKAAEVLGINRNTLRKKLNEYTID
ncbi:MAG: helix-turn-helix domain-containing protein [Alphaproteobacteria bacterium]